MAPAVRLDALLAPLLSPHSSAEAWAQLVQKNVAPALLHGKALVVDLPDDLQAAMRAMQAWLAGYVADTDGDVVLTVSLGELAPQAGATQSAWYTMAAVMDGLARAVVQAALRAVGLPANALENVLDEVQLTPSVKTASALQGVDSKGNQETEQEPVIEVRLTVTLACCTSSATACRAARCGTWRASCSRRGAQPSQLAVFAGAMLEHATAGQIPRAMFTRDTQQPRSSVAFLHRAVEHATIDLTGIPGFVPDDRYPHPLKVAEEQRPSGHSGRRSGGVKHETVQQATRHNPSSRNGVAAPAAAAAAAAAEAGPVPSGGSDRSVQAPPRLSQQFLAACKGLGRQPAAPTGGGIPTASGTPSSEVHRLSPLLLSPSPHQSVQPSPPPLSPSPVPQHRQPSNHSGSPVGSQMAVAEPALQGGPHAAAPQGGQDVHMLCSGSPQPLDCPPNPEQSSERNPEQNPEPPAPEQSAEPLQPRPAVDIVAAVQQQRSKAQASKRHGPRVGTLPRAIAPAVDLLTDLQAQPGVTAGRMQEAKDSFRRFIKRFYRLQDLVHASGCRKRRCKHLGCQQLVREFKHFRRCGSTRGCGCLECKQLVAALRLHADWSAGSNWFPELQSRPFRNVQLRVLPTAVGPHGGHARNARQRSDCDSDMESIGDMPTPSATSGATL